MTTDPRVGARGPAGDQDPDGASRPKVRIDDLEVTYQRPDGTTTKAVDHVDLTVGEGEFLTLIGPSGCGKTSLLNAIGGLVRPSRGRVVLDDTVVEGPLPQRFAFIFQDFALFPWRTALGNVEIALELQRVRRRERRERALDALQGVGLADVADRYPRELSGGMKQRVAVARALVLDCDVLLLDEPFGALDEQTRLVLGTELCRILERTGKSIVFVTHSLQEAAYLSDRVVAFSRRPCRVRAVLDVALDRPRHPGLMSQPAFQDLQARLFQILFTEAGAPAPETASRP
ncbi:MAG TPA: ABC transporter ATP-binding protein [Acidimicrobiales bacterium]|jgi:NitT/TauT family transport system ATP-binding protein|nr:ABC transporter ATP-binding protein [Acidimicrobiales bacterium]